FGRPRGLAYNGGFRRLGCNSFVPAKNLARVSGNSQGNASMDEKLVYNLNVVAQDVLPTPEEIKQRVPLTDKAEQTVLEGRFAVERILDRKDHRFIVVVGPCSIHDPAAA